MSMYIIVAIVFGIVAGVLARAKGRSSLSWFIAGLIIGPFALVVAVLPPRVREGHLIECPACAEVVRTRASICRYCGSQME